MYSSIGRAASPQRSAPWKGSIQPGYSGGRVLTSSSFLISSCGQREFLGGEIVLKLVEAFCANDDRRDHRLCQEPCEGDTRWAAS